MTILQHAAERPRLFLWVGPPAPAILLSWVAEHDLSVPNDLLAFWKATGGGDAFETEVLLAPIGAADPDDGLWPRNQWHRSQGMSGEFVVFHEGCWLSAFRAAEPRYVTLSPVGYWVDEEYPSFAEWYQRTLRSEFWERYGLAPGESGGRRTTG